METSFKVIESKITSRNEFNLLTGYQPTHSLFYLKEGTFIVEIDGIEEEIKAGDCVILPNYIHFNRRVLNPIVFVYIKFSRDDSSPFHFDLPYGKVNFKDKNRFLSSITSLENLLGNDDIKSVAFRNHLLCDILYQLYFEKNPDEMVKAELKSRDNIIVNAYDYIKNNIDKKIIINDICKSIGTNPTTLNYRFRRELNMSVGEFIKKKKSKKIKHFLLSTTYPLAEISEKCGFENVYYFSNFFKKRNRLFPNKLQEIEMMETQSRYENTITFGL